MGSENVYEWQKQKISQAFPSTRLFGWYGHTEKAILAPMCEYSDDYHVWPFYGYTEVLDENNEEVSEGKVGELIGTSFWSYATPFIRYRTMDMAKKGKLGHDKCGRNFQLLESVEGRVQDTLISKTGRHIPVPSTSIHSDVFNNVNIFQFYQDTQGRVLLRVVKKDSYSNRDTAQLYSEVKHKLGEDMEFEIVFVDHISKTSSGKYRVLDQKLLVGNDNAL